MNQHYPAYNRKLFIEIQDDVDTILRRSVKIGLHSEDADYIKEKLLLALTNFEGELVGDYMSPRKG